MSGSYSFVCISLEQNSRPVTAIASRCVGTLLLCQAWDDMELLCMRVVKGSTALDADQVMDVSLL